MYKLPASVLAVLFISNLVFSQPVVSSMRTNIRWGGRTVAISAHATSTDELIAASATGGLFKSSDGGANWRHLDNLPVFSMMDVAYNPIFKDKVIATCLNDTDTTHRLGIWLSNDRGETWTQADAWMPVLPAVDRDRYNKRYNAYGISFDMNGVAYVGTDYGVAMGKAAHTRWEHVVFDRRMPVATDKLQNAVYSVKAFGSGKLLIGTRVGVYYCNDMYLGHPFVKSMTDLSFVDQAVHSITQSPYSEKDIIIAPTPLQLWISVDTGKNFISKAMPEFDRESRGPVVAIVKTEGNPGFVDVYVQRVKWWRKTCYKDELATFGKDWVQMNVEHDDIDGYAVVGDEVRYVTTDGGVFKKNSPDRWRCVGTGRNGYNALQVYQVWGQKTEPLPSTGIDLRTGTPSIITGGATPTGPAIDYYFGTQDNDIWSSPDRGLNWPHWGGTEGGGFDGPRVLAGRPLGIWSMVFIDNSIGKNRASWPLFNTVNNWHDPGIPAGNPKYAGNGTYLQLFPDTLTGDTRVMQTQTYGSRWETVATINSYRLWQNEKASVDPNFTMYIPYARALPFTNGFSNIGLLRLKKTTTGGRATFDLRNMDMATSMGSLMVYAADFAWPTVYGFDHNEPDKLLAPDVESKVMKWSLDGGNSWRPDVNLTRLITENDRYLFCESAVNFLVWTVSFNPSNSNEIAIGTKDAGIVYTRNGGANWCRIPGSKQIPSITSIWWDFDGTALVSSYGRGVWRINFAAYRSSPGECVSTLTTVRIADLTRRVSDIPFIIRPAQTTEPPVQPVFIKPNLIAAEKFNGTGATAGIISSTTHNGEMVVGSDGRFRLTGFGFVPVTSVNLELNGKVLVKGIAVNKEGKINHPLTLKLSPGIYKLSIVQYLQNKRQETPLVIKVPFRDKAN